MGVITRAFTFTGTPTEAQWNVDIDAIISEITGQLDSANCDTTSSDAIMTLDVAQTKTARQTFSGGVILDELLSTANAGSGHVKIADIRWDAGGGSLADNDGLYLAFTGDDSGAAETEYMRLALNFDDVTATNEDASLVTSLMKAGTLTSITTLTNVALSPTTTDAVSLGTSSLNWSDLFLDSGAVINFDSGNVTLTHSSSTLTVSGNLSVGGNFDVTGTLDFSDSAITNAGDIQLDSITGDGDTDTSITFSGSNVITVKAANANQVTFTDGGIIPSADNDIDLGSGSYEFKDAYFDGTVTTDGLTVSSTTNLDGAIQVDNTITVGVDDTGHDVKFFGASAGAYLLYDESADTLDVRGATAAGAGKLKLTTGELTVVDGDILGRIDFQAPLEASGTDAVLVGASIWAEADDTFGTALNDTDLVFAVAESETAAERMRLSYDGTNVALAFTGGDLTITSGGGDISFDNENLSTTGTLASGALTVTGAASTTGNIHLHTNNTFFTGDSTGGGPWNLVGIDGSNDIIIGETSGALNTKIYGAQLSFIDTSATRMIINAAGNVGINEASPAASTNPTRLHVSNGTAIGAVRVDGQTASAFEMVDEAASSSFRFYFDDDVLYMQMGSTTDPTTSHANSMRINAASNVGLNVAPSAWDSGYKAIHINTLASIAAGSSNIVLNTNAYYGGGSAWSHMNTGIATGIYLDNGVFAVRNAPSASADADVAWATRLLVDANGGTYIGDSANANMTQGLTINQGASDDEAFALKSSDVGHAMTALAEADTYGHFTKADASAGGFWIEGFRDTHGAANQALALIGSLGEAASTDDTTSSWGVTSIRGRITDGSTGVTVVANSGNLISFQNSTTCRLLIKGNGDLHATNITSGSGDLDGVALDDEDDVGLIRAMERFTHNDVGIAMTKWDEEVKANEADLRRVGVLTGDFYSIQRYQSLLGGGIWQNRVRMNGMAEGFEKIIEVQEKRITALEKTAAQLTA